MWWRTKGGIAHSGTRTKYIAKGKGVIGPALAWGQFGNRPRVYELLVGTALPSSNQPSQRLPMFSARHQSDATLSPPRLGAWWIEPLGVSHS